MTFQAPEIDTSSAEKPRETPEEEKWEEVPRRKKGKKQATGAMSEPVSSEGTNTMSEPVSSEVAVVPPPTTGVAAQSSFNPAEVTVFDTPAKEEAGQSFTSAAVAKQSAPLAGVSKAPWAKKSSSTNKVSSASASTSDSSDTAVSRPAESSSSTAKTSTGSLPAGVAKDESTAVSAPAAPEKTAVLDEQKGEEKGSEKKADKTGPVKEAASSPPAVKESRAAPAVAKEAASVSSSPPAAVKEAASNSPPAVAKETLLPREGAEEVEQKKDVDTSKPKVMSWAARAQKAKDLPVTEVKPKIIATPIVPTPDVNKGKGKDGGKDAKRMPWGSSPGLGEGKSGGKEDGGAKKGGKSNMEAVSETPSKGFVLEGGKDKSTKTTNKKGGKDKGSNTTNLAVSPSLEQSPLLDADLPKQTNPSAGGAAVSVTDSSTDESKKSAVPTEKLQKQLGQNNTSSSVQSSAPQTAGPPPVSKKHHNAELAKNSAGVQQKKEQKIPAAPKIPDLEKDFPTMGGPAPAAPAPRWGAGWGSKSGTDLFSKAAGAKDGAQSNLDGAKDSKQSQSAPRASERSSSATLLQKTTPEQKLAAAAAAAAGQQKQREEVAKQEQEWTTNGAEEEEDSPTGGASPSMPEKIISITAENQQSGKTADSATSPVKKSACDMILIDTPGMASPDVEISSSPGAVVPTGFDDDDEEEEPTPADEEEDPKKSRRDFETKNPVSSDDGATSNADDKPAEQNIPFSDTSPVEEEEEPMSPVTPEPRSDIESSRPVRSENPPASTPDTTTSTTKESTPAQEPSAAVGQIDSSADKPKNASSETTKTARPRFGLAGTAAPGSSARPRFGLTGSSSANKPDQALVQRYMEESRKKQEEEELLLAEKKREAEEKIRKEEQLRKEQLAAAAAKKKAAASPATKQVFFLRFLDVHIQIRPTPILHVLLSSYVPTYFSEQISGTVSS